MSNRNIGQMPPRPVDVPRDTVAPDKAAELEARIERLERHLADAISVINALSLAATDTPSIVIDVAPDTPNISPAIDVTGGIQRARKPAAKADK